MTRSLRRLTAVSASALTLLAVAGCGTPQAGAAAVVGDRRITVSEVQQAFRDVTVLAGADAGLTQTDILNWLILGPMVLGAAEESNVGVSESDALTQFAEVRDRLPDPSEPGLQVVRTAVALQRLQGGEVPGEQVEAVFRGIIEDLQDENVEINPRYGASYDLTRLVVEPGSSNWLRQSGEAVPDPAQGGTTPEGTTPEGGAPAPEGGAPAPEGGVPAPEGGTAPTP